MGEAVTSKIENDLVQFKQDHHLPLAEKAVDLQGKVVQELEKLVAPPYPELFASGIIVNGFIPQDKRETETLFEAIKAFKINIVLVVDNEKLENDIRNFLMKSGRGDQVHVI